MAPCHYTFVFNVQNVSRVVCPKCQWTAAPMTGIDREDIPTVYACPNCSGSSPESKVSLVPVKRRELCLHWTQRSCDIALGVPFNISSYAALTHIIAKEIGVEPGILAGTFVDLHAYTCKPDGFDAEHDHIPGLREQLTRPCLTLPKFKIDGDAPWDQHQIGDFRLEGYTPAPTIKFKVAV
jgi:thymidylate synthase